MVLHRNRVSDSTVEAPATFALKSLINPKLSMNTCTKVFLRKKAISGGRISLYLDLYPAIRNPHTNRMSRRETLGIYIYASPKNERERQFNASMEEKAETIRCRRFEQLLNEKFDFLDKEKQRMDFLAYIKTKCREKYQKWDCVYRHFDIYCKRKMSFLRPYR